MKGENLYVYKSFSVKMKKTCLFVCYSITRECMRKQPNAIFRGVKGKISSEIEIFKVVSSFSLRLFCL